MSEYCNDHRVHWIDQWTATVTAPDDLYVVEAQTPTSWLVTRGFGSRAIREANLRTQEDAEAFAAANWWGPYQSVDAAITEVLTCRLRRTGR